MRKVLQLKKHYDIIISLTEHTSISGHFFEAFDYYIFLKQYYLSVGMLFVTDVDVSEIRIAYEAKYQRGVAPCWNDVRYDLEIISHEEYNNLEFVLLGKTPILYVDGSIEQFRNPTVVADNIFMFRSGVIHYDLYKYVPEFTLLQDERVYSYLKKPNKCRVVDYVKKINGDCLKEYMDSGELYLLYLVDAMRYMTLRDVRKLLDEYEDRNFILCSYLEEYDSLKEYSTIVLKKPPLYQIWPQIKGYIYTPVPRQFDSSPRWPFECKHYGKSVEYYNIHYHDPGLEARRWDIENRFDFLYLRENDPILEILDEVIV